MPRRQQARPNPEPTHLFERAGREVEGTDRGGTRKILLLRIAARQQEVRLGKPRQGTEDGIL